MRRPLVFTGRREVDEVEEIQGAGCQFLGGSFLPSNAFLTFTSLSKSMDSSVLNSHVARK